MSTIPDQQTYDEIMGVLRDALDAFDDTYRLSRRTGLSQSCINNIRRGKTKWPRWNTIEVLMIPLNLRLSLRQY